MEWERDQDFFAWDGSGRDIYVHGTTIADWQRLLDVLRSGPYELHYAVGGEPREIPESIGALFALGPDDKRSILSVDEPHLALRCHFFSPDEIEFDIDPRAIDGESRLERLLEFMRMLGQTIGKQVILTPENAPHYPYFRFDPRADG